MKKIIITILVGLFSCQTPLVNKDNITKIKDNSKPDFSGKDCIPYKQGNPPVEKFKHYTDPLYDYGEKSPIKKENPYLGEIKVYINPKIVPYGLGGKGDKIEVNLENKYKIEELEKEKGFIKPTIKVNNKDLFYMGGQTFEIMFNNSCEYRYFNKILNFYETINFSFRNRNSLS